MPETAARLRYSRVSPPKVRQVLHLIVGKDVNNAREILRYCERGPAEPVMKLLDSAIANAEHNDNVPEDELFVVRAYADEGPTAKRWRPRARGRGTRIRKRTSHITIIVARFEEAELERRRERDAAATGPARVSRRRRVAASRKRAERAELHDHDDHDHDHDHDDEVDETVLEAFGEDAPLDQHDAAVEQEEVDDELADDTELLQDEAPMTEGPAAEEFVNGEEAVEEAEASAGADDAEEETK
jgi:large subunit ribosomal protein L22